MATIHVFDTGIIQLIDRRVSGKTTPANLPEDKIYTNFISAVEGEIPIFKIPPPFRTITIFDNKITAIFYDTPLVIDGRLNPVRKINIDRAKFNADVLSSFTDAVYSVIAAQKAGA